MYIINLKVVYSYVCIQRVNSIYIITRHASTFSSTNPKSKSLINSKEKFSGSINGFSLLSFHPLLKSYYTLFGSYLDQTFLYSFCFSFRPGTTLLFLLRQGKCQPSLACSSFCVLLRISFFFFLKIFFPRVQRSPILIWAEILPRPCGYSYIQSVVASSPSFHSRYRFFKKVTAHVCLLSGYDKHLSSPKFSP